MIPALLLILSVVVYRVTTGLLIHSGASRILSRNAAATLAAPLGVVCRKADRSQTKSARAPAALASVDKPA
jgi:hypothetical protein